MNQLQITLSDGTEKTIPLEAEAITVGRADDNLIHLDEVSVSGHHAELAKVGSDYFLKDLGSTNGTRVNGEPVSETHLQNSDRIEFGHITAIYLSDTPAGRQPLPQSEKAGGTVGSTTSRPANFGSTTQKASQPRKKDSATTAIVALGILSILALGAAIFRILSLQAPL